MADLRKRKVRTLIKPISTRWLKIIKMLLTNSKRNPKKGKDTQMSAWAKSKIPALEHHLTMAEDIQKNLKIDGMEI